MKIVIVNDSSIQVGILIVFALFLAQYLQPIPYPAWLPIAILGGLSSGLSIVDGIEVIRNSEGSKP